MQRMSDSLFPCPCCGYLTSSGPESYDICPICFWEDDISQLRFPESGGGANQVPLIEAQANFDKFGASDDGARARVRSPRPDERRDPVWRTIDPAIDDFERAVPGLDYGRSYP